jgi:hypothetical protein
MMKANEEILEFSLFGGPLQRLGRRLGLVREGTNTVRLGLALGFFSWAVLIVLGLFQGSSDRIFSSSNIGGHVRLLVAIPLFFLCETLVAPRIQEFIRNIVHSGVVPESEVPALTSAIRRISRLKDPWVAEIIFLLLAITMPAIETFINLPGKSAELAPIVSKAGAGFFGAPAWYVGFCMPLFRFLMFRWLWHLGLWWYFLRRLEKLKLHLIPTHSDGAGGLGYLEVVQEHFMPLVLAISAVVSSFFAEDIISKTMAFSDLASMTLVLLFVVALLFIGPLFIFARKLWICRITGMNEYMVMAAAYVDAFDRKWIRDEKATGESQLGTADMQSLADLTNSVNVVRKTRLIPVSQRLLVEFAICVFLPLVPLLFIKYRGNELAIQLFEIISGK